VTPAAFCPAGGKPKPPETVVPQAAIMAAVFAAPVPIAALVVPTDVYVVSERKLCRPCKSGYSGKIMNRKFIKNWKK